MRIHVFSNRIAINNFVHCLHSQLPIIRSFDIRFIFYFFVRFKFPCEYGYDLRYGQHLRASYAAVDSWLYSWPTQFQRYFVFCQLTLKCKCWTIEATCMFLVPHNIVLLFIVLRRLFGVRNLIYTICTLYISTIHCYLDFW